MRLPSWLMWTQLQFLYLPQYLRAHQLQLRINNRTIRSFPNLTGALLFSRLSYAEAVKKIEKSVDEGKPVGIDVALKYLGLLDHVMFVYGYDADAFYVFDTHKVPMLEYTKLTDDHNYFMRLPREVAHGRWTIFSRVWELRKTS